VVWILPIPAGKDKDIKKVKNGTSYIFLYTLKGGLVADKNRILSIN
jgi:hypothetical protein